MAAALPLPRVTIASTAVVHHRGLIDRSPGGRLSPAVLSIPWEATTVERPPPVLDTVVGPHSTHGGKTVGGGDPTFDHASVLRSDARPQDSDRAPRKHYVGGERRPRHASTVGTTVSTLQRDPREQVQILDEDGQVVDGATVPDLDDETFVEMYRSMKLARHFDERAVSLQRQGRMGTYPPLSGQEGSQVASAMALDEGDWLFPSYREHGSTYVRGVPLDRTLRYWMGDERGNSNEQNVFPIAVPIATQVLHATGAAWAARLREDETAFLCYFGDGATSEGDFHEGLNFAGVFDAPCVFFCNNNQWAISVPRERQTAAETIAQKAIAYGFEGVQVDGMDPLAVYRVTYDAVEKAKHPEGDPRPTLIEAVQYRFGAHTTADDPTVYRDEAEVAAWRERDPIPRLEGYLRETGRLDDAAVDEIEASVREQVSAAIDRAERTPRPDPEAMFADVYAERTAELRAQQANLNRLRNRHGDDAFLRE